MVKNKKGAASNARRKKGLIPFRIVLDSPGMSVQIRYGWAKEVEEFTVGHHRAELWFPQTVSVNEVDRPAASVNLCGPACCWTTESIFATLLGAFFAGWKVTVWVGREPPYVKAGDPSKVDANAYTLHYFPPRVPRRKRC